MIYKQQCAIINLLARISGPSFRFPFLPMPPKLVYMWLIPPKVVVYMSRVCVYTAPDGAHLVHALEELDIVCLSREVAKGVLHHVEPQQLHMTHR